VQHRRAAAEVSVSLNDPGNPLLVPLAERVGVAPGNPKLVVERESGVGTMTPFVIKNAFITSPLPW